METWVPPILAIVYELSLFSAVVFALFGVDDLLVDALALAGAGRRGPRGARGVARSADAAHEFSDIHPRLA